MSKFYEFRQNNSGGYFVKNDDVRESIVIEENNKQFAIAKMQTITEAYSEHCECCGQRWETWGIGEYDSLEQVKQQEITAYRKGAIIYFLNGTKENINYKED